jgi:phage terminase large subunit
MVVLTFDGPTKIMSIEMSNIFIEEFVLMFSSEKGMNLHPTYNDTKGLDMFMKKTPKPFNESHYKRN